MSLWRLELLRLWRTRRIVAIVAVFVILGLGLPILTYYLPDLIQSGAGGVRIVVPKQTAADSMTGFGQNAAQLGTLVLVVVAAASLSLDAHPGIAAFYRSRTRDPKVLVLPRLSLLCVAAVGAFALGVLCAWYETRVLFGGLSVGSLVAGFALESLWFGFCVAVVSLWAGIARGVLAVVGSSLATLLALVFVSSLPRLSSWSPSALSAGLSDLVGTGRRGIPWPALGLTLTATLGLMAVSAIQLAGRKT